MSTDLAFTFSYVHRFSISISIHKLTELNRTFLLSQTPLLKVRSVTRMLLRASGSLKTHRSPRSNNISCADELHGGSKVILTICDYYILAFSLTTSRIFYSIPILYCVTLYRPSMIPSNGYGKTPTKTRTHFCLINLLKVAMPCGETPPRQKSSWVARLAVFSDLLHVLLLLCWSHLFEQHAH